jgi:uncharacterized protein DUF4199
MILVPDAKITLSGDARIGSEAYSGARFQPQLRARSADAMKKAVWTYGLISGAIISVLMLVTLPFEEKIGVHSLTVGYATMVLAFLMIYFGIRSYRDTVGGGSIGFGRALAVGSLIAVISSVCYTATWEVVYFQFMPDFLTKYQTSELDKFKASGASQAAIDRRAAEMRRLAEMYRNPVINSAMTFVEPLPVGLVIALVSAGVLRRRRSDESGRAGVLATG